MVSLNPEYNRPLGMPMDVMMRLETYQQTHDYYRACAWWGELVNLKEWGTIRMWRVK